MYCKYFPDSEDVSENMGHAIGLGCHGSQFVCRLPQSYPGISSVETGVGEGSGQMWSHAGPATVVMTTCLHMKVMYASMGYGSQERLGTQNGTETPCQSSQSVLGPPETPRLELTKRAWDIYCDCVDNRLNHDETKVSLLLLIYFYFLHLYLGNSVSWCDTGLLKEIP